MVVPAGNGDVDVVARIPSVPGFDISPGLVLFTVTVTLPAGTVVTFHSVMAMNYAYGDLISVLVPGLIVGQNYVFAVSALNGFGTSGTSHSMPMEIRGELALE